MSHLNTEWCTMHFLKFTSSAGRIIFWSASGVLRVRLEAGCAYGESHRSASPMVVALVHVCGPGNDSGQLTWGEHLATELPDTRGGGGWRCTDTDNHVAANQRVTALLYSMCILHVSGIVAVEERLNLHNWRHFKTSQSKENYSCNARNLVLKVQARSFKQHVQMSC